MSHQARAFNEGFGRHANDDDLKMADSRSEHSLICQSPKALLGFVLNEQ